VFISYVRDDSRSVDELQRVLEQADIPVWRDTDDLWPGEDWKANIRRAITAHALVFLACFSELSLRRGRSFRNEELVLAIEQLRLRPPGNPWLIPVRFDECPIPDLDNLMPVGRTLAKGAGGSRRLGWRVPQFRGRSVSLAAVPPADRQADRLKQLARCRNRWLPWTSDDHLRGAGSE
jgi:hypothetical protein